MGVSSEAGPWGAYHWKDVTAIIQAAIDKSAMEMAAILDSVPHHTGLGRWQRILLRSSTCREDCPACAWIRLKERNEKEKDFRCR
jgi:hypothetical protein